MHNPLTTRFRLTRRLTRRLAQSFTATALWLTTGAFTSLALAEESIVFATDWKAQAEHGGFYQAKARGFYADAGLDVTIRMGGPGSDNQQLLAAGAVDMAMGSNNFFPVNLVAAGAPTVAVMAAFQKDPQILMSHPRDDVSSLSDMAGMPIMISDASVNTFWAFLKHEHGFEDSQIRKYTYNMAPFLVDDAAIQQGYLSSEPKLVADEGVEPEVYLLADDGYPSYSAMVLVPQDTIDSKPDMVQAFVNASIEGWYDYLYGDPTPGNDLIKADNPDMTDEIIAYSIEKMKEYGIADSGETETAGIGAMTDARWETFFSIMSEAGIYEEDLDYRAAYTLDFVNQGHGLAMKP